MWPWRATSEAFTATKMRNRVLKLWMGSTQAALKVVSRYVGSRNIAQSRHRGNTPIALSAELPRHKQNMEGCILDIMGTSEFVDKLAANGTGLEGHSCMERESYCILRMRFSIKSNV